MKNDFEQRRAARLEAARRLAEKNRQISEQSSEAAYNMTREIPPGQPILTGHHSEGKHRRHLAKVDAQYRKSTEADKRAEYHEDKAAAIENNNAIFSDDPNALKKLTEKIAELTALQEFMKVANKYIKKGSKAAFLLLPNATPELWEELTRPGRFGGQGYAHYSLTNNNANIRRLKIRLQQLENIEQMQTIKECINGVEIFSNKEANRLQMFFKGKPQPEVRANLKRHGFRWSPREGAWQKHLSKRAIYDARDIANNIPQ